MTMPAYAFAGFRLDPAARELWRGDTLVALPPKSFDCLVYLIANHERAVGRDELISAVWGRVDVNDALLAQTLLRARRAIGDTGNRQTTIRTVPRFGYRWIGAFEELAPHDPVAPDPAQVVPPTHSDATPPDRAAADVAAPASATGARWRVPAWLVALAAPGLVFAVAIAWRWDSTTAEPESSVAPALAQDTQPSIVVLPVEIADASPEAAWIRLGVMDYVARRLRESGQFKVLPSEQVVALTGAREGVMASEVTRIAAATGARWVVRPAMRRVESGWTLRLLIDDRAHSHEADGQAKTPLEAAALASERLLRLLGARVPADLGDAPPGALAERIQRIDAALLAGDIDGARRLVEAATDGERADPALGVREAQIDFRAGRQRAAAERFAVIGASEATLPADVRAQALMGLGAVAVRRAEFADAEKRYAEALAVLGDGGDPNLVGNAYGGRGVARGARSQVELALADLGRARIAFDRAGNPLDAAAVDTNWGLIESGRSRFSQALPHFDRAIAVFERFGVRDNLAASLLGKARAQLAMLDLAGAAASSARAYSLARGLENTTLLRNVAVAEAEILLETGRLEAADTVLRTMPPGDDTMNTQHALLRARLALARADPATAEALLRPLLTDVARHADVLPPYVAASVALGDVSRARAALQSFPATPDDDGAAFARALAAGRLAEHDADPARAEAAFASAVQLADRLGNPRDRALALCSQGRFLIARHQLDRASAVVGELAPWADRDFRVAQVTRDLYQALGDEELATAASRNVSNLAGERSPELATW
jgi:DNA-binding winged helix-turn-helix (wHTH) protein/tetratricopeptide (TPR) repeat protein/TolB-like protein